MAYYGKRAITLNANSAISATVADYPAYVKLTTTNCPSIFYAGVDATKVKFTSDAEGTTQLDHELVREAAAIIEYFVKTSAWTIYLWLGDDDESDTSNPTGVWGATAKYIGHFITDANDSSANGNDGTVDGATLTADSNYLGGHYYLFDGSNDYISLPTGILNSAEALTFVTLVNADADCANDKRVYIYRKNSTSYQRVGINYGTTPRFTLLSVDTSNNNLGYAVGTANANGTDNFLAHRWIKGTSKTVFQAGTINTSTSSVLNETLGNFDSNIGKEISNANYFKGKIGFMWIFSDAKSDDFISAVYNNMEDYDNFVTIGSEGAITGVPFSIGEDKPIIRILDSSGNVMDNSLESGTYISFGTLPRGYSTWVDIYIGEYLGFPLYNAVLTGVESDNQLGEADETYESLSAQIADDIGTDNWTDLPLTLGTIAKGQYYHVRLRYTAGDDMALGIKVFAIKVTGDWSG